MFFRPQHFMILGNRKAWTEEEITVFNKYWQPESGKLPSRKVLDEIQKQLPHRSIVTLRSRASNILRSTVGGNKSAMTNVFKV